jgi:hypothetical protein
MPFLVPYKYFFTLVKSKFTLLLQIVGAFLLPIKPLIFLVGFMIVIDTATGIWKAKKSGEKITSKKLSQIVSKMVLYQVALISMFLVDKLLLGEFMGLFTSIQFFLTKVVAIFFCSIELLSINENIKVIYKLNLFQMFKSMLVRAKELKNDITDITDTDQNNIGE